MMLCHAAPPTLLMDGAQLEETRRRVRAGDAALQPAFTNLIQAAEAAMTNGPFSVVNKTLTPASGDKHDYLSFGRYWWPDPDQPDGLPYIRRDGETNPDSQGAASDRPRVERMTRGVEALALAYYLTGETRYAERAGLLLRTWFLDPATRMNPNLNHAQAIPGRESGRKSGLIDARLLCQALDGLALLEGSAALRYDEHTAIRDWFKAYLKWLKTNKLARAESDTTNNHGTFFDAQIMHVALYAGDKAYARSVAEAAIEKRVLAHIRSDGSQPEELARTRTLHYSLFNLEGFFALACLAEHTGVDLWRAGDSRLRAALDYVAPYADPALPWPHPTIREADRTRLLPLLLYGASVYDHAPYRAAAATLPAKDVEGRLEQLVLWLMR
jgi:hypothetical protein